jgi:hypothetical protein
MSIIRRCLIALGLFGGLTAPLPAADPFTGLLPLVPDSTNYLVLIDVRGLHRSPLGVRNRWPNRHVEAFRNGAIPFHSLAETFLFAAGLGPDLSTRAWEINLANWARVLTPQDLGRVKGIAETVAGTPVVLTPRGAYLFVWRSRVGGAQFPADRQKLGRWLRWAAQNQQVVLSEYLREAAADVGEGNQIVAAVDLADQVGAHQVGRALEQSRALAGGKVDLDALASLLAGVRGMRFRVRVDDAIHGEFRIDFVQEAKPFETVLGPLLLRALTDGHDDLEGLDKWDLRLEGKAVRFRKQLSEHDLENILVKLQPAALTAPVEAAPALDPQSKAAAARHYFQTVTGIVTDMRRQADRADFVRAAQLHDTAADRIDRLPTFGVDPDLQEYAASVSSLLRMLAESLRGVPVQVSALQSGKVAFVSAHPASIGFVPGRAFARPGFVFAPPILQLHGNVAEIQARQAQVIADDGRNRLAVWRKYDEMTAQMRRSLAARYMTDF